MSVTCERIPDTNVFKLDLEGRLTADDYHVFVPDLELYIRFHGKLRLLMTLKDFHGWEMGALWEDLKFDMKHFFHVERIAIVGEDRWQKGMPLFMKPFTTARIKYFEHQEAEDAEDWILEGIEVETVMAGTRAKKKSDTREDPCECSGDDWTTPGPPPDEYV